LGGHEVLVHRGTQVPKAVPISQNWPSGQWSSLQHSWQPRGQQWRPVLHSASPQQNPGRHWPSQQTKKSEHVPQLTVPLQPFETDPQVFPCSAQISAVVLGRQEPVWQTWHGPQPAPSASGSSSQFPVAELHVASIHGLDGWHSRRGPVMQIPLRHTPDGVQRSPMSSQGVSSSLGTTSQPPV
jgi:hypothetical protein